MRLTWLQGTPWWFALARFPYHIALKNYVKGIPGAAWVPASKTWRLPIECVEQVSARARGMGFTVGDSRAQVTMSYAEVDPRLHEFQRKAVQAALLQPCPVRWIYSDEMGLGKTPEVCVTLNYLQPTRTLIVCPAIVRLNWVRELDTWWPGHPQVGVINLGRGRTSGVSKAARAQRDAAYEAPIQIVSYALLEDVQDSGWDTVVFDEAHRLASPASLQTRTARGVVDANPRAHVLGATATIIPDQPQDCYSPCHVVWPGRFGKLDKNGKSSFEFNSRYSVGTHNGFGWAFRGVNEAHADEFRMRLAAVSSRTTKQEVAHLLPPYDVRPLYVRGGERLDHVEEWIKDALQNAPRVAVLCHLKATGRALVERLSGLGKVVYVDGDAVPNADTRNALLAAASKEPCILVATMHSVGIGIDLTGFSQALLAELYERPETVIQVLGRFSRLSGTVPSSVRILVIEGTQDERRAGILGDKIDAANTAVRAGATEAQLSEALAATAMSDEELVAALQEAPFEKGLLESLE